MTEKKRRRKIGGKQHYGRHTQAADAVKQAQLTDYLLARYGAPPADLHDSRRPPKIISTYRAKGKVVRGEAVAFLRTLETDSADVVFLDPPFNLGKKYGTSPAVNDTQPEGRYRLWMGDVFAESARVLRPGGALYLYHLPLWAMRFGPFLERFLDFRQWIAVSMKNGFAPANRLYPAHYALLCFTKGSPQVFNRPKLPLAKCRHCGDLIKDYGGYLPIIAKRGINLSDIWDDFSPVRHAKHKFREANELPRALFERVLAMSSTPGGLYVDPFAGAGSGVIAALDSGMRFAAGDMVLANSRLLVARLRLNGLKPTKAKKR